MYYLYNETFDLIKKWNNEEYDKDKWIVIKYDDVCECIIKKYNTISKLFLDFSCLIDYFTEVDFICFSDDKLKFGIVKDDDTIESVIFTLTEIEDILNEFNKLYRTV